MQASRIPVRFVRARRDTEPLGFVTQHAEPVSFGVPFARGALGSPEQIDVRDHTGRSLPRQVETLALWPDGSVRWALIDLVLAAGEGEERLHVGAIDSAVAPPFGHGAGIAVDEHDSAYVVDTGAARFEFGRDVLSPFAAARSGERDSFAFQSRIGMEDADGERLVPRLENLHLAARGPIRLTLAGRGEFCSERGAALCRFAARVSFFAATALVRLDLTVHNPRASRHRGGVWDLGDPGSILFRGLRLDIQPIAAARHRIRWRLSPGEAERPCDSTRLEIHQASSGGEQWASRNHVDRSGNVALPFRGCRVTCGAHAEEVERPQPVVAWIGGGARASVAVPRFWQEFPKCIEAGPDGLRAGLFPSQGGTPFELQGGEQKTHTVWLHLGCENGGADATADLGWVHDPLVACVAAGHLAASAAFPHLVPEERDPHTHYVELVHRALDGPDSFFAKREIIDEYGWRNFGDIFADHEDEHFTGPHPVIAHYNNQYDLVYGFLLHFARSSDPRWFELAADLARHVIDIDIYHTSEDKPAYGGGLFWHTDHYQDAGRATHRSYTAHSPRAAAWRAYGGGPSNENNYTSGLLYFHYLTGDPGARAAVLELAEWVLRMDDGTESLLGHLDAGPTGLASSTREPDYHGPGRGAGNSINAMLDAFRLTAERRFLAKAEELIARCVHPCDDPERRELRDAERRWSYTVFLQALGKYLDSKNELGERDAAFAFARSSLTRYALWMAEHESPFAAQLERVEYPTESWPAHDVRKSCVFDYAARYGPAELRERMTERAELFFGEAIAGTLSFPAPARTRPLAILLASGVQRAAFRIHPPEPVPEDGPPPNFGSPTPFLSQKSRVRRRLRTAAGILALARAALHPAVLRRLWAGRIW